MEFSQIDPLYAEIKTILGEARATSYRAVNFAMVVAYWEIGKRIVEAEQAGNSRAEYGAGLIKVLSKKLTAEFGKGFNEANLKNFRQFYQVFNGTFQKSYALRSESQNAENESIGKSYTLRSELSWSHYRLLMRVENENARNYYLDEAIHQSWSTRALERQINSFSYERILSSKNKKEVKDASDKDAANTMTTLDLIKDPYVLEFLQLPANTNFYERNLEAAIIGKLQHFLLELGKGFSFVAQQKRISAANDHFYIDLIFYNYILKCFVLIDLKLGKLTHQDIGQMDFYVRWVEENMKDASDNPTIGIILCSEKNETIVKYSVLKDSKQLFASRYQLYLPTEEELKKELEAELLQFRIHNG